TAAVKARYTYDAFGQKNRAYGVFAATNPFGFSSKYEDSETGLLYYGYRYYDPVGGRWLSRDPIGEEGGLNLYGFVGNNAVSRWDYLGLDFLVDIFVDNPDFADAAHSASVKFTGFGDTFSFGVSEAARKALGTDY